MHITDNLPNRSILFILNYRLGVVIFGSAVAGYSVPGTRLQLFISEARNLRDRLGNLQVYTLQGLANIARGQDSNQASVNDFISIIRIIGCAHSGPPRRHP